MRNLKWLVRQWIEDGFGGALSRYETLAVFAKQGDAFNWARDLAGRGLKVQVVQRGRLSSGYVVRKEG